MNSSWDPQSCKGVLGGGPSLGEIDDDMCGVGSKVGSRC